MHERSRKQQPLKVYKQIAVSCIGALIVTLLSQAPSAMSSTGFTLVSPYGEDTHHHTTLQLFSEHLSEMTESSPTVELSPDAELFAHDQIPRAVRTGSVELGEILMATLVTSDPIYALDNLPFIATDFDSARVLWETSRAKQALR